MKSVLCLVFATIALTTAVDNDFDRRCTRICTDIFAPICASNGEEFKIFPSECVMAAENCNLQFKEKKVFAETVMKLCHLKNVLLDKATPQEDDLQEKCVKPCFYNWDPLCGFDGVNYITFPNQCFMEVENCLSGGNRYSVVRNGECIPSYIN